MDIKFTKSDIFWNYSSTFFKIFSGIILLPFILKYLDVNSIGIWYVFLSISSLITLLDFGFSQTFLRNFIYTWSGAHELYSEGVPEKSITTNSEPNIYLFSLVLKISQIFYLFISILAFLFMVTLGTIHILNITKSFNNNFIFEWLIFLISSTLNVYFSLQNPLLRGIGAIKESSQTIFTANLFQIIISITLLLLGFGVFSLSIGSLVSSFILGILSKIFLKVKLNKNKVVLEKKFQFADILRLSKILVPNSLKLGLVILGSWLILKSSSLIISLYFDLFTVARYGLTLQIIGLIGGLSSLLFQILSPVLINLRIKNEINRLKNIFSFTILTQWVFSLILLVLFITFGPLLLSLVGSNSTLLPLPNLLLLSFIYFLEWNHSTFSGYIALTNRVPFLKSSLISGLLIITLSLFLIIFIERNIIFIILSQGLIQLLYNNWKWPLVVLNELKLSIIEITYRGTEEFISFFHR